MKPARDQIGKPASMWGRGRIIFSPPERVSALVIAGLFAILFPRLWVGDLFNSYPFMSDDSFDWVTQGVALVEFVSGEDRSAWPILRPPGFVFVHALDHLFGTQGIVFYLVQVSALAGLSYFVARFASMRGAGFWPSCLAGMASVLSVVGIYSVWILSDAIASSLMTISAVMLLNAFRDPGAGSRKFLPAILVAIAAGLTQTYGMIPALVMCAVFGGIGMIQGLPKRQWAQPLFAAMIIAVGGFGLQRVWAAFIPHGMQPETFGLLEPSLGMLPFYTNVWPLVFGAYVPVILWAGLRLARAGRLPGKETFALMAVVGAFAVLSFGYQWAESRMTYIYVPIFVLMVVALGIEARSAGKAEVPVHAHSSFALGATFGAALIFALTVVPGDYWRPSIAATRIAPGDTWIAAAFRADPVDRYKLRIVCGGMDNVCDRAVVVPQSSPYRDMMLQEYKRRMTED